MHDPGRNVARHLRAAATQTPDLTATLSPLSVSPTGRVVHAPCSFHQLDQASDAAARLFHAQGITQGTRVLLAVRPGHDLIVCMFGLLKLGAVPVAIDPGMGLRNYLHCVRHARPTALVAIRPAYWLSLLPLAAFDSLEHRVTVGGRRWRQQLAQSTSPEPRPLTALAADAPAARPARTRRRERFFI